MRQYTKNKAILALVITCTVVVVGLLVIVCRLSDSTSRNIERLLEQFLEGKAEGAVEELRVSDVVRIDAGQKYIVVCVLGPYQNRIKMFQVDGAMVKVSDTVDGETVQQVNALLLEKSLRSGEGAWNILLLNRTNELAVAEIRSRKAPLAITNPVNRLCVPYEHAVFRVVEQPAYPYGMGLALMERAEGEQE